MIDEFFQFWWENDLLLLTKPIDKYFIYAIFNQSTIFLHFDDFFVNFLLQIRFLLRLCNSANFQNVVEYFAPIIIAIVNVKPDAYLV